MPWSRGPTSRELRPARNSLAQCNKQRPDIERPPASPDVPAARGMRVHGPVSDAIRRYCEAFPALDKRQPLAYTLPPPAWCARAAMPPAPPAPRPRRHSHRAPRKPNKTKKRRCSEGKENLPEWVTAEGAWDEDADPVREFIRALAGDARDDLVPDWTDVRRLEHESVEDDASEYAKFEAKFDSSLEALWSTELDSDLAASPASEGVWSGVELLREGLRPLRLADEREALCCEDAYVSSVASSMRSLAALNHSKTASCFAEVLPRQGAAPRRPLPAPPAPPPPPDDEPDEDLLTSARTHFRPIDSGAREYADGLAFPVNGDLDSVEYRRSSSGSLYVERDRYLELRDCAAAGAGLSPLKFCVRQLDAGVQTEGAREACDECSRLAGAKRKRRTGLESIWSWAGEEGWCGECASRDAAPPLRGDIAGEELSREWEELLTDISAAHARYAEESGGGGGGGGCEWRKRRHSAALWCARGGGCPLPHDAPFLHCCAAERPLTR